MTPLTPTASPSISPAGPAPLPCGSAAPAQTAKYLLAEGSTTDTNPLFLLQTGQSAGLNNRLDIYLRTTGGGRWSIIPFPLGPVFDGTWHHLAYVDNLGAVQLYVDGQADATFTYTPSGSLALNTTTLGALVRSTTNGFFNGAIDDVLVWTRALSQAEVQSAMTNSLPPLPPPAPPAIVFQSPGSTNALGDYVSCSAQVLGDPPFSYQWLLNGLPLPGQTNSSLLLPTAASGSNWLALLVTNLGGSLTGAPIPFVVLPDPTPNLSAGLVSWWPLDSLLDDSGAFSSPDLYSRNDLSLKPAGPANLVPGKFGSALSLDGLQQYGLRSGGFPIYLTTNYSVSFWVKGAPGQTNKQVFAEGGPNGNFFLLGTENSSPYAGALSVKLNPGMADRKSSRVVFDNSWHHILWLDANGKARLFVDGALDETDFSYPRANLSLESTALGALVRSAPANFFAGAVDDLALWARPLTFTELQQLSTNSPPPLASPLPPAIFSQPADRTNGIVAGDFVSFSVVASGTAPLHYQWQKDGLALPLQTHPSAASNVLAFAHVQAADAGSYCVVITNAAGAVTSAVVQLAVLAYTPVTNGVALLLDIDLTGTPNTQPGFQAFSLGANPAVFSNALAVSLSPIGGATLTERLRSSAPSSSIIPPPSPRPKSTTISPSPAAPPMAPASPSSSPASPPTPPMASPFGPLTPKAPATAPPTGPRPLPALPFLSSPATPLTAALCPPPILTTPLAPCSPPPPPASSKSRASAMAAPAMASSSTPSSSSPIRLSASPARN